ncbi:MAG: type II toxin-antitoxin system RelE/ParE family toxin [Campylobacterota bacterium]|nr:type II toxin-antitoxin system RelE/ParE family toxin [Campylobacterota bacterium]
MRIEFLPEAKYELDDAVDFYELQLQGLGGTFKNIAKSTIKRVSMFPTAWTEIKPSIRRCIMHKFPYNVLYSIEKDCILIIAIAHHHRNPNYWTNRVKS